MPYVTDEALEATDLDELLELTARARLVQEMWRDIFTSAIAKALSSSK